MGNKKLHPGLLINKSVTFFVLLSSGNGEYGVAGTADAVTGFDAGTERAGFNLKSLIRFSLTGEADYNSERATAHEAASSQGDNEVGGIIGKYGGQISFNGEKEINGFGLKKGIGFNLGVNQNYPLFGGGYNKNEGFYLTGPATN